MNRPARDIKKISFKSGMLADIKDAAKLPLHTWSWHEFPAELKKLFKANRPWELAGRFGSPDIGDPIQYHYLKMEGEGICEEIEFFNLAIAMFAQEITDDLRRLFQCLIQTERMLKKSLQANHMKNNTAKAAGEEAKIHSINRGVAIIKPKEPYLNWIRKLPDPDMAVDLEELRTDCLAILVPEKSSDQDGMKFIKSNYRWIYDMMLGGWWTQESDWPKDRNWTMFLEWFDVEFHSLIIDPLDRAIIKE